MPRMEQGWGGGRQGPLPFELELEARRKERKYGHCRWKGCTCGIVGGGGTRMLSEERDLDVARSWSGKSQGGE